MPEMRIPYIDHDGDLEGLYERWLASLDRSDDERSELMRVFRVYGKEKDGRWHQWRILMDISERQRDEDSEAFATAQGGLGVMGPGVPGGK